MATTVSIANAAATRIGSTARIVSLDDDRTVARTIKSMWDISRRAVLRDGSWNFAARRAELAAEVNSERVIYPWAYAFPLPASSLRLIEVLDLPSRVDYQLEDGAVLCNSAGPLRVRYAIDVPELARWDELAAEAFALRLAWRCGHKIAGSAFDKDACWRDYREALGRARNVDAIENPPIPFEDGSWIEARQGGAW